MLPDEEKKPRTRKWREKIEGMSEGVNEVKKGAVKELRRESIRSREGSSKSREGSNDEGESDRFRRRQERERYFTTSVDANTIAMASTTGGTPSTKLAQEIHDEFLTCKICLEGFKTPKCLDCLHTFCEQCIDNHVMSECTYKKYSDYREFTCPLCRKRTQLPIGGVKKLPDNFLVSSLDEVIGRQKPSKYPFCDICKLVNRKHREATSKCLDCNKLLCKQCVELHKETKVTKNHSLFDCEIEKDIECKEHKEEVVRFYCEPCETCICVLCTFNEHKDHEITQFTDAVSIYKETIQQLLDNCKAKIKVYDGQLGSIGKCQNSIKDAEQKIRDSAIEFIADIRTKEKQLIEDLHNLYGIELMDYVSKRDEMQVNLDSLKSTCNLTEVVLKGKDIELLLLKKQVQEKLSSLSDIQLSSLPATVQKQYVFLPGTLDFGFLQDSDSPSKKIRPKPERVHSREERKPTTANGTQTEAPFKPSSASIGLQTDVTEKLDTGNNTIFSPQDDKSTTTDVIDTVEKAVNTRSRSLQSLTNQLRKSPSKDENETANQESPSSPPPRRVRRRRERPKPVEITDAADPVIMQV